MFLLVINSRHMSEFLSSEETCPKGKRRECEIAQRFGFSRRVYRSHFDRKIKRTSDHSTVVSFLRRRQPPYFRRFLSAWFLFAWNGIDSAKVYG
jgi:hypothetical protein